MCNYQDEVEPLMKELAEAGQTIHWLKSIFSPRRTLLVIDMQNDFITGALPVPGAAEIIPGVEALTKLDIWYQVGPPTRGLYFISLRCVFMASVRVPWCPAHPQKIY